MPLLKAVADKLSQEQMEAGVIEEIIDRDELFALFPFTPVTGKAYVYDREDTGNAAADTSAFVDTGDVVPESSADVSQITTNLRILIGDVDVDKFVQEVQSDKNDQKAIQIALKAKYLARKFRDALVNGDSAVNAKQFDGLKKLVTTTGNQFAAGADGAALSLDMLDDLLDRVPVGADALMMHSRSIRKLRALLRATSGTDAAMIEIPNFGASVLSYNGVPIIRNDFIGVADVQGAANTGTSIYALRLNEADGFHGLYGGTSAGIRVEDIGTVQNKDATRTRLKWYCGAALKSTRSVSRLFGVL